ncbi:uncharacterized protein M421DRAFT_426824 [Didymella exigua CBS 183.55]|uniref:Uncharacterized protein n=1 Tax=Didymella exigua CBS 183.55 TaxID=1150837 RepID=A0A6A5R5Q6_9PLEO|nr:uncharacterized protein M421DRAFT_426824 [Didymella exigua CBS 183.55]KAF1922530.1 hypothetical protein M421DRAFT_426824 [Didymella exigua CBS 183.55]
MAVPRVTRNRLSPTAHLLRNSRLFALPNPLPRPVVGETTGAGVTKASDSATLPYPTHQAITTTKSSRARGDWGLKRNLPARSHLLQTSDPVLRIAQLDTIEDVTDFDSAADHVRTRQKWEQMAVPMMRHVAGPDVTGPAPPSAFEPRDDTTSYRRAGLDESGLFLRALRENKRAREYRQWRAEGREQQFTPFQPPPVSGDVHNTRRWKHDGPWLPGQSADDFSAYLAKEIAKRRREFNEHLVEFVKNEIYTTRQLAAARAGDLAPMDEAEAQAWQAAREKEWAAMTPDDVAAGIKALRKETALDPLRSKLVTKLITPFLRLPPVRDKNSRYQQHDSRRDYDNYIIDPERAPTSTHPSAGLGYLRTRAYLASHPILGPQASPAPVTSRVLQPRLTAFSRDNYARLGVGGFVTLDQHLGQTGSRADHHAVVRDVETIDITTPGGKKMPVNPLFAAVSNDGRVHLKVRRASGAEAAVARGALNDVTPPLEQAGQGIEFGSRRRGFKGFARPGEKSGVRALDELGAAGRADGASELLETSAQARLFQDFVRAPRADTATEPL